MSNGDGKNRANEATVGELLREQITEELKRRENEWKDFTPAVLARMEVGEAISAQDVLRTESELSISEIVSDEIESAVLEREPDWSSFGASVAARLDAPERAVAGALDPLRGEAVSAVSVSELLVERTEHELARRDGDWSAFTASVFRQLGAAETATARAQLEERAIDVLKADVESELQEMGPAFEERFREGVERLIFKSARVQPTWRDRLSGFWESLRAPKIGWGIGWAAAAAAAIAFVMFTGPSRGPGILPQARLSGEVSVDRVSFEGTVTLMQDEGVTVIWLSDSTS